MGSDNLFAKVIKEATVPGFLHRKFIEKPKRAEKQAGERAADQASALQESNILLGEEKRRRRKLLLQPGLETNLAQATGRKQFLGQ